MNRVCEGERRQLLDILESQFLEYSSTLVASAISVFPKKELIRLCKFCRQQAEAAKTGEYRVIARLSPPQFRGLSQALDALVKLQVVAATLNRHGSVLEPSMRQER